MLSNLLNSHSRSSHPKLEVNAIESPANPFIDHTASTRSLVDPVQSRPVHSNLVIHLISLADDAVYMLVLRVHFFSHGSTMMLGEDSVSQI